MKLSRYMESNDGGGNGGGTTVQVNDNAAVTELARKVGELESGRATVEEVNDLKAQLATLVASRDQFITRADFDSLKAQLDEYGQAAAATNRAPAEIKPPTPPPPTQAEIEAQSQAANQKPSGPARMGIRLFGSRP